jgi:hypothetical protein
MERYRRLLALVQIQATCSSWLRGKNLDLIKVAMEVEPALCCRDINSSIHTNDRSLKCERSISSINEAKEEWHLRVLLFPLLSCLDPFFGALIADGKRKAKAKAAPKERKGRQMQSNRSTATDTKDPKHHF